MRAIIYERYGGPEVLELREVEAPPLPGTGQLTVRVAAAALNPKDVLVRKGKFRWMTGLRFPQTPGYDVAGVISAVGPGVHGLNVGMPVYGMIQSWKAGAYAESVVMPAAQVAPKPPSLTMAEAAAAHALMESSEHIGKIMLDCG